MRTSASGRAAITRHEGLRLTAYPDPATGGEPWTVGVGHTSRAGPPKVTKGMKITRAQAEEILSRDLATFEAAVSKAVKVPLNQNEFDALVSLAFNIGAGAFAKSTLVKKLNAGNRASGQTGQKTGGLGGLGGFLSGIFGGASSSSRGGSSGSSGGRSSGGSRGGSSGVGSRDRDHAGNR